MDVVIQIGRLVRRVPLVVWGFGHLNRTDAIAGHEESLGAKQAKPLVVVSGLLIIAGGVIVLADIRVDLGPLLLGAFLSPTVFLLHPFRKSERGQQQMGLCDELVGLRRPGEILQIRYSKRTT